MRDCISNNHSWRFALVLMISIALFGDLTTADRHIKPTADFKYPPDRSGCSQAVRRWATPWRLARCRHPGEQCRLSARAVNGSGVRHTAQTRRTGLHVPHHPELIPAGADQRRHHPPLGDGFGRVAAMLESLAVARRATTALSAAVHPAALPPAHSRLLARCPAPGPGMETPPQGNDGGAIAA
jgi:hypothetical protein